MARWPQRGDTNNFQTTRSPGEAFLLDSVGCALGGYQQHDVKIALKF